MPVLVNNVDFTDVFGNTTGFYKSNTVDEVTAVINVEATIRMTSVGNQLTLDPSLNQVLSPNISWVEEGFRVGDEVLIYLHQSGGAVINNWWTAITYVDDVMCDFTSMPDWMDITAGEFITMYAVVAPGSYVGRSRSDMDLLVNHVKNNLPGSEYSLIDGEVARVIFTGIDALGVGGSIVGILTGNQSAQFLVRATLFRISNAASGFARYKIEVIFMNSGMYDSSWFQSAICLKAYFKMLWASYPGEPFDRTESIYNLEANTGWFNEPHNTSINNSTIVSGPATIDWATPTTFDVVVDGPLAELGIGSAYRSITPSYYKVKPQPQQELAMAVSTQPAIVGVLNSYINPVGGAYTLEINSVTTVLTVHTINVTITPNAAFTTFMDNVEDGDRLFYVWVKCGNINHLGFAAQLTKAPPIGGPITMVQDYGYLDHAENVTDAVGDLTGFVADTEDNVAYIGTFRLLKGAIYKSFTVKIEAHNTANDNRFPLQSVTFGFAAVQISGAGVYLLNESANITTELPTTSVKRNAFFMLEPSLDTPTEYGVKIYAPWLLNWRYWQQLIGASVDFYPNQDRNWERYDNLPDWEVRTRLELIDGEGLLYFHNNPIVIREYEAEIDVDSSIDIFLYPSMLPVSVVPQNSGLVLVRATHIRNDGFVWNPATTWGEITSEAVETAPRWLASSAVDFDNNVSNPVIPVTGLVIPIQFPAPTIAILESIFNPSLLNMSNGASFTGKIKDTEDTAGYEYFLVNEKEAVFAWDFYKLREGYNGPCIAVRRDFDNAVLDIPFDGIYIDIPYMLAFVNEHGEGRGYVQTIYGQEGFGNNGVRLPLNSQPQIVFAGAVQNDPDNGKLAMWFDGVDDMFDLTFLIGSQTLTFQTWVMGRYSNGIFSVSMADDLAVPFCALWYSDNTIYTGMGSTVAAAPLQNQTGNQRMVVYRNAANGIFVRSNNAFLGGVSSANAAINYRRIGQRNGNYHNGPLQHLCFWVGVNKEPNLAFIENWLTTQYG